MEQQQPILLVCGSRKPPPGVESASAARTMLHAVARGIADAGGEFELLDVRKLELPFFDGRVAADYDYPDAAAIAAAVERSERIVLSVPAYWGGPSGVVKNLLDLLGGAAYDVGPDRIPPLVGKVIALLVVGADVVSAGAAAASMRLALAELGAWTAPRSIVIGNPREFQDVRRLITELSQFGAYVVSLAPPVAVTP